VNIVGGVSAKRERVSVR